MLCAAPLRVLFPGMPSASTSSLKRTTLGVFGLLPPLLPLLVDCLEPGRRDEDCLELGRECPLLDCFEFGLLVIVPLSVVGNAGCVGGDILAFCLLDGLDVFTLLSTIDGRFHCLLPGLDVLTAESTSDDGEVLEGNTFFKIPPSPSRALPLCNALVPESGSMGLKLPALKSSFIASPSDVFTMLVS